MTPSQRRLLGELAAITITVILLWTTPVVWPLKMLVVFFHELSHALMALATGGHVQSIQLLLGEGGLTLTRGGNLFLILSAGYLGSLVWGGVLLLAAAKASDDALLVRALGGLMLVVTVLLIRNWFGFGFGLVTGIALIAGARHLPQQVCDLFLKTVGLVSCFYVIPDIWSDTIARSALESDARMLAELTHIPTMVWGFGWILLASAVTAWALKVSFSLEPAPEPASKRRPEPPSHRDRGASAPQDAEALLKEIEQSLQ